MTAVEDYECKLQVWEEQWPHILDIAKIPSPVGLQQLKRTYAVAPLHKDEYFMHYWYGIHIYLPGHFGNRSKVSETGMYVLTCLAL